MSQVLVGEIVFKLKADADNMVRSLRKAAAEVRRLEADQKKLVKSSSEVEQSFKKEKSSIDAASSAMNKASTSSRNLERNKGRLSQVVTNLTSSFAKLAIKAAIVLPAIQILGKAVAALAIGAFSLVSALAPLSGALVLYPAIAGAAATSMLLLGKSLAPVIDALSKSNDPKAFAEALGGMNAQARTLTTTLAAFKRELGLVDIAQKTLFPSLITAVQRLSVLIPSLRGATAMLGVALGRVADYASRVFSSTRFLADFNALAVSNARTTERFGRGLVNLGNGLSQVLVAAIPLIDAVGRGFETATRRLTEMIEVGRASGGLEMFFFKTYRVGKQLLGIIVNTGAALGNLSDAGASALGGRLLDNLEKATARFKAFTESANGARKIREVFISIEPVLAQFGLLLRDVVIALAGLSNQMDAAGIFKKIRTELLPALVDFATKATTNIIPALIDTATAFTKFASAFAFGPVYQVLSLIAKGLKEFAEAIASLPSGIVTFTAALFGMYKVLKLLQGASLTTMLTSLAGLGATSQAAAGRVLGLSTAVTANTTALNINSAAAARNAAAVGTAGAAAATSAGRFTAAGRGLLAAVGGPIGIAVAGLATGFFALKGSIDGGRKSAEEFIVKTQSLYDPARMNFGEQISALEEQKKAYGDVTFGLYDFTLGLDVLREKLEARSGYDTTVKGLEAIKEQAAQGEFNLSVLAGQAGLTEEAMKRLANELGIDLRGSISDANEKLQEYFKYTGDGTVASAHFSDAARVMADELSSIEQVAGAVNTKLNAFSDNSLLGAVISRKDALASFTEALKNNGVSLDTNAEAGRRNLEAAIRYSQAVTENIAKAQEQGATDAELNAIAKESYDAFVAKADAMGLTAAAAEALAKQVGLIPENVDLVINAGSLEEAQEKLKNMGKSIRGIEESTPEFQVEARTEAALQSLTVLDQFGTKDRQFIQSVGTDQAMTELLSLAATGEKPRIFNQSANIGPATGNLLILDKNAKELRIMPLDLNSTAARGELFGFRALASQPITIPISVRVSETVFRSEVARDAAAASRNRSRNANGNIYKAFANGGVENHVAEIASGATIRMWAEPETGGEAYIPLAQSKRTRSMQILRQTAAKMGAKVSEFANGSPVKRLGGGPMSTAPTPPVWSGQYTPGSGLANSSKVMISRGAEIQDLQDLIASYQAYIEKLAQAAQREQLVMDLQIARSEANKRVKRTVEEQAAVTDRLKDAQKRLAEFDTTAFRQAEIDAVNATIDALRKEEEARQEAYRKEMERVRLRQSMEDNRFEAGALGLKQYIEILDKRLAAETRYTDAWMALSRRRQSVLDEEASRLRGLADQAAGKAADALAVLNQMLDEYESIQDDMVKARRDHGRNLERITEEYNSRVMDAEVAHFRESIDALENYNRDVDTAMRDRRDSLTSWARIDEVAGPLTALPIEFLTGNVRQQIAQFDMWASALDDVRRRGVSEEVIAALNLDAGPQSLGQLKAFAAATDDEIRKLNAVVLERTVKAGEQVKREATALQGTLGQALIAAQQSYAGAIAASNAAFGQSLVQAAEQMRAQIASENEAFSGIMVDLQARLAQIGVNTGRDLSLAIAAGIRSGIPAIQAAAEAAAAAARAASNAAAAAAAAEAAARNAPTPTPVITRPRGSAKDTGPYRRAGTRTHSNGMPTATYDKGGVLAPGLTQAYNATGRNEYIMTGEQIMNKFAEIAGIQDGGGMGGDLAVNVYLDGQLVRGVAKVEVQRGLDDLRREVTKGRRG